ncbi:MAG: phytanoyl-CoA dioxygenase family protein [Opitutales bacterium]|nr:phytanoyl-CoA dioxygenase family protein [Opitutales bacterium]
MSEKYKNVQHPAIPFHATACYYVGMNSQRTQPHIPRIDDGNGDHDPLLYETLVIAEKVDGFSSVTDEHLDFYTQEGYLAIENAFDRERVEAAKNGLLDLIMGRVPDFESISFEAKAAANLDSLSVEERQDAVRKLMFFVDYEKRLQQLATDPDLLALIQRIIGSKPRMFQDMALIKPPKIGREKPWHQDQAYFNYPLETKVVGVWIALDEATRANGCMHVQPRGHQQGPVIHFKRRDWQICDTEIMGKPCVAVPLKPGGILLFNGLLPHGTPSNYSGERRKALQFHYFAENTEAVPESERLATFGSEGKNVEC